MLCLTRRPRDKNDMRSSVRIKHAGQELLLTIGEVRGQAVVLEFDGPETFNIARAEIDDGRKSA